MNSAEKLWFASTIANYATQEKRAFVDTLTGGKSTGSGLLDFGLDAIPGLGAVRSGREAINNFSNGNYWSGAGNLLSAGLNLTGAGALGKLGLGAGKLLGQGVGLLGKGISGASKMAPAVSKLPTFSAAAKGVGNLAGKAVSGLGNAATWAAEKGIPGTYNFAKNTIPGVRPVGDFIDHGFSNTRLGQTAPMKFLGKHTNAISGAQYAGNTLLGGGENAAGKAENYATSFQNMRQMNPNMNPIYSMAGKSPTWESASGFMPGSSLFSNN